MNQFSFLMHDLIYCISYINVWTNGFQALHAARLEAQMNLSRVLMEERAQRDLAVQQALVQGRAEMSDKLDSVTVVTEDKVSYNVTWPHQATQNNIENIICNEVDEEEEDSDKEK